jgi:hypothetical protein
VDVTGQWLSGFAVVKIDNLGKMTRQVAVRRATTGTPTIAAGSLVFSHLGSIVSKPL